MGPRLAAFVAARAAGVRQAVSIQTGDAYKDQVQEQWDHNPVGSHYARESQPHTLEWFLEVERHRYGVYAPWMPDTMEMAVHAGHDVLEIGGGMGTDLAQFAAHGAAVTDLDLSAGHLELAAENFRLRGLRGRFIHHDAETLPFDDGSFDLVYSNGVLHHTPNTSAVVREIRRVLRPGGRAIVMFYAENSLHYWRKLVWALGVKEHMLDRMSMGEIMSRSVERTANEAKPLVKVYTARRLRALFRDYVNVEILQRQLLAEELPGVLRWTLRASERRIGWNLIVKAAKP
jgi:ubiquinone/menaquinone biosynthesis C-methylase UbiE